MIKRAFNFFKRLIASRLGQLIFVAHLVIVIYLFAQMSSDSDVPCHKESFAAGWSTIAGRSFHWTYEPFLTVIFLLDLPAVLISGIITTLFLPMNLCDFTMSWVSAVWMLFFASLQWLLIGFWIEGFIQSLKNSE